MSAPAFALVPECFPAPSSLSPAYAAASPARRSLGNYGSKVSPPSGSIADRLREARAIELGKNRIRGRRRRITLQNVSRALSNKATIQWCGSKLTDATARVGDGSPSGLLAVDVVQDPGGEARFKNLTRCGSVWECPCCMDRITAKRRKELVALLEKHEAAGGGSLMLTLTVPHYSGDELENLAREIPKGWQYCISGAPWKRMKSRVGFVGFVKALETTHGVNGWHNHIHVILLFDRKLEDPATGELLPIVTKLRRFFYCRWSRRMSVARDDREPELGDSKKRRAFLRRKKRRGLFALPSYAHGANLVRSHRKDYIAKMGLADELTRGAVRKKGRRRDFSRSAAARARAHRTPLQILADVARRKTLKCYDAVLWKEYARAMRGHRQLTFSRGLREKYDLGPEQTDSEIIRELDNRPALYRLSIEGHFWRKRLDADPLCQARLLEIVEIRGPAAGRLFLERLGHPPPNAGPPPPKARPANPQLSLIA